MFSHLGLRTDGTMLEISATLLQKLFLDKNSVRTRVYINPGAYRKMKEGFFMPYVKIIYIEKALLFPYALFTSLFLTYFV